jgi:hypothetical protein
MNNAGTDTVCEGAMLAFTKTPPALLAIPLGLAFAAEDCFAYPTVDPLPSLNLFFVGLLHH